MATEGVPMVCTCYIGGGNGLREECEAHGGPDLAPPNNSTKRNGKN